MKRREFIKKSLATGIVTGSALTFGNFAQLLAYPYKSIFDKPFDLVAIKGGEPDVMFDKGIQSLGGMKAFIKKGQTVVVKPNIGWDAIPERAANTNPILIKSLYSIILVITGSAVTRTVELKVQLKMLVEKSFQVKVIVIINK